MTGTEFLPAGASSSLLPEVGDLENDDEDAAGYEAMMSELPTIVYMSGLLDGDFDELNGTLGIFACCRFFSTSSFGAFQPMRTDCVTTRYSSFIFILLSLTNLPVCRNPKLARAASIG